MEIASTVPPPPKNVGNGYDTDFYAWTQEQARLLLQKDCHGLDWANLAEEIASLGKQQKQELRSRLGILIGHLLKWDYQSDRRSQSWRATIRLQRDEVGDILQENPSLKPYLAEAIEKGFRKGCNLFIEETSLDFEILPRSCPYTIAQLLDPSFPTDGAED
jgi:hypothetical protein